MHGELPKFAAVKAGSKRRRNIALFLLLVAVAGGIYYVFFTGSGQQQVRRGRFAGPGGPVPVLAESVKNADVPVYLNAVGTVRALNTVTVRAQVDGKLLEVAFKEGQDVKQGDVLARIDPATYQAAYNQAVAKKAQDEALLANARNDLARYETLATTNAINKQQVDTQRSLVAQYEAQVKSDVAAIDSAAATLSYTTIRAPLDGRTGIRQVDAGNLVRASDSTGVVVITQVKPISVLFNVPQQDLNVVNAAFARGALLAEAVRTDNGELIERGQLTVVDNQVDATTGTVKLKAEFPNANLSLWPGQFVNVRLQVDTLKDAVVIPTGAVQRGPNGTFVYAIGEDNKATIRQIQVKKQDETQTVVASGVTPPERVITTGFARLTDGATVAVSTPDQPAAAGAAAPGQRRPRGEGGQQGQRGEGSRGDGQRGGNTARPNAAQ